MDCQFTQRTVPPMPQGALSNSIPLHVRAKHMLRRDCRLRRFGLVTESASHRHDALADWLGAAGPVPRHDDRPHPAGYDNKLISIARSAGESNCFEATKKSS
jgi:hypothetical protein